MARAKQKSKSAAARRPAARKAKSGRPAANRQAARRASARGAKKTGRAATANERQDRWSAQEDRQLKSMVKQGASIRDVVAELGRSESAVRQHVYKLGLALRGRRRAR